MNGSISPELQELFNISNTYLKSIKKSQKETCAGTGNWTQPTTGVTDISKHVFIPNFKANNWIEDGLTAEDVRLYLLNNAVNWTSCPIETPFLIKANKKC